MHHFNWRSEGTVVLNTRLLRVAGCVLFEARDFVVGVPGKPTGILGSNPFDSQRAPGAKPLGLKRAEVLPWLIPRGSHPILAGIVAS